MCVWWDVRVRMNEGGSLGGVVWGVDEETDVEYSSSRICVVFFQAGDGMRELVRSCGLGDVYSSVV